MLAIANCLSCVVVEQALVVGYIGWLRPVAQALPQISDAREGAPSDTWSSPYLHRSYLMNEPSDQQCSLPAQFLNNHSQVHHMADFAPF